MVEGDVTIKIEEMIEEAIETMLRMVATTEIEMTVIEIITMEVITVVEMTREKMDIRTGIEFKMTVLLQDHHSVVDQANRWWLSL